ncbi:MAG: FO synthase [Porticoccaceae bacterium]|nr:MAG: FO synthase [Porticoccaceae bacterium]
MFIPLTRLCRDVCHYCTFAATPRRLPAPYLSPEEVLAIAREGRRAGCLEALFTLGDRPEARYRAAREALAALGQPSTLAYLREMADLVWRETGLLPHLNPGLMSPEELAMLREVSVSMGIMLETTAERLSAKGGPHYGSPDKVPARRLATLEAAGRLHIPFTTGLLVGIGETRRERLETLLAIRELHARYGHIQEVIVQNFRAKPGTRMAHHPEPSLEEQLWTIAAARLLLGPEMSIQAPPNLRPEALGRLIEAGVDDWGGISPVTPDHVNPEAPWPHLERLARETEAAGKVLRRRLAVGPAYVLAMEQWIDARFHPQLRELTDAVGLPREDDWRAGAATPPPAAELALLRAGPPAVLDSLERELLARARRGDFTEAELAELLSCRDRRLAAIARAADELRRETVGEAVTWVANRNINYTNVCNYRCGFCAFSKGKVAEGLRDAPYDLPLAEIVHRAREAQARGATEVCLQGGIHPAYTGETYLAICRAVREACPELHIHAFSPLEVFHGAETLGISVAEFLAELKAAGLNTLPGTAAEVLDDEVRAVICPDKLTTAQWLEVVATAHRLGLPTTSTLMFGHVDAPRHWARHLLLLRRLQAETGGLTEFVPLPFVAAEAPLYKRGRTRPGPTFRECLQVHAVARLALHPLVVNIQASWVKLGLDGVVAALACGANDVGGTLMNESISRAAGARHGQELAAAQRAELAARSGRPLIQRTTLYRRVGEARLAAVELG